MVLLNFKRADMAMDITRPILMILGHQERGGEDEKLFLAVQMLLGRQDNGANEKGGEKDSA